MAFQGLFSNGVALFYSDPAKLHAGFTSAGSRGILCEHSVCISLNVPASQKGSKIENKAIPNTQPVKKNTVISMQKQVPVVEYTCNPNAWMVGSDFKVSRSSIQPTEGGVWNFVSYTPDRITVEYTNNSKQKQKQSHFCPSFNSIIGLRFWGVVCFLFMVAMNSTFWVPTWQVSAICGAY